MKQTEIFAHAGWVDPVFIVVRKPPPERIYLLRNPDHAFIGDFAWHNSKSPEDEFIHCTGYDCEWRPIWYADFAINELDFVQEKPKHDDRNPPPKPCPYPVKFNQPQPEKAGQFSTRRA